jgi:integrase
VETRAQASNSELIDRLLIPEFGHVPLTGIIRTTVLNWRDGLGERPGTANRSLPVLSVMMTTAEAMGLRPKRSNPRRTGKPLTELLLFWYDVVLPLAKIAPLRLHDLRHSFASHAAIQQ